MGTFIGIIDFLFFEIYRNLPIFQDLIYAKPKFLSLSYASFHILSFLCASVFIFYLVFYSKIFLSKRLGFIHPISVRFFSLLIFTILILGLRLKRIFEQPLFTIIFVLILIFLNIREFRKLRQAYLDTDLDMMNWYPEPRLMLIFTVFVVFSTFIVPDFSGFYSRVSDQSRGRAGNLPNIIFIVLDTLRADHLSCYGYSNNQTPNFDLISREGVLFLNAHSASPWTLPSHASMFTGLYTSQHRTDWGHEYLTEDHFTIAEYLRSVGYRTAGFSENPNVNVTNGLAQGFQEFHGTWRAPLFTRAFRKINRGINIRSYRHEYTNRTSGLFRRWIMDGGETHRPFFAFVNFMVPHLPRYPRTSSGAEEFQSEILKRIEPVNLVPERFYLDRYRLDKSELSVMRKVYDQEISYLDRELGKLMSFLKAEGILEDSILVITSDHGENFGDHGFIEHQFRLSESLIHVPLVIRYPKILEARIVNENVSTVAIFRTIVEILDGLNKEQFSPVNLPSKGSLFDPKADEPIISEYYSGVEMMKRTIGKEAPDFDFSPYDLNIKSLISGKHKYIWYSTGKEELFDLDADPGEVNDLSAERSDLLRNFQTLLWESVEAGELATGSEEGPVIDQATRDALKALGYER